MTVVVVLVFVVVVVVTVEVEAVEATVFAAVENSMAALVVTIDVVHGGKEALDGVLVVVVAAAVVETELEVVMGVLGPAEIVLFPY